MYSRESRDREEKTLVKAEKKEYGGIASPLQNIEHCKSPIPVSRYRETSTGLWDWDAMMKNTSSEENGVPASELSLKEPLLEVLACSFSASRHSVRYYLGR